MEDVTPVIWERHLQSGLLGLLSIASVAMAGAAITAQEDIAVVKNDVRYIQERLSSKMDDRWTGSDHRAYSEFDALRANNISKDIERNAQRIKELEERLDGND